jgi:urea transport system substrate-binding protein
MSPELLNGLLMSWNYLMAVEASENLNFIAEWRRYRGDPAAVVNDAMAASVVGFRLWSKAVETAGTTAPEAVRQVLSALRVRSLTGVDVFVDRETHHLHQPAMLGRLGRNGAIDIVWRSAGPITPEPAMPVPDEGRGSRR